jgi:hypothetical protein
MKKIFITFLLFVLALTACLKSDNSSSGGLNIFGDDTKEAIARIEEANTELKKVKVIYRANQGKASDLKEAMMAKDIERVKSIADELVIQINEGLILGNIAVDKIKEAEGMNINETYKKYLELKRESLERQLEAFELRRQVAKKLSEIFGRKDEREIDTVQIVFREKEESFQKLMEEGKNLSLEANQIAKDAVK